MSTMIAVDSDLVAALNVTLTDTRKALQEAWGREEQLRQQADADKLLTETDACQYLGRDVSTLQYYRRLGLHCYKKGQDVWFRKGDIDAWLQSGKVARHRR